MEDILNYERLVTSIAIKFKNYYDLEDLKQVGMIGLIKALNNFKLEYNTKFSSYAYTYIFGEILKYVNENKPLKISKDLISLNNKIISAKNVMTQRLGREPSITEISLFLEIPEELINEAINASSIVKSLDYILNEDSEEKNTELYDVIGYNDKLIDPEIIDLYNEIDKLPDGDKQIIYYRYFSGMTQSEVSKILHTNQVSVSRNESKILRKLKDKLTA